MKIIWSETASISLDKIYQFISKDSEFYAHQFVTELLYKITFLPQFPRLGKVVKEINKENTRQIIHERYRIIYKLTPSHLEIVEIVHGSRDFKL